jgi:hypothetical protein
MEVDGTLSARSFLLYDVEQQLCTRHQWSYILCSIKQVHAREYVCSSRVPNDSGFAQHNVHMRIIVLEHLANLLI